MKRCLLLLIATALTPAALMAQGAPLADPVPSAGIRNADEWRDLRHNPMLRASQRTGSAQQKTSGAHSWLISDFSAWTGPSTGPYYTPYDSSVYSYSGTRGGAPELTMSGSDIGYFSTADIPYDGNQHYGGWTDASNRFNTMSIRRQRIYDAQGNLLSHLQQTWDNLGFVWQNQIQYTYTYVGNNMQTCIYQLWHGTTVANQERDSFFYNSANQLTIRNVDYWYGTPGAWVRSNRNQYTYDAAGNCILNDMQESYNGGWRNYWRDLYTFTAAGMPERHTTENWSIAAGVWKMLRDDLRAYNSSNQLFSLVNRDSFGYAKNGYYRNIDSIVNTPLNSAGLPLLTTVYSWTSGAWIPSRQYTETYNSFNQLTSEYGTHWENGAWMLGGFGDYAYRYHYASDSTVTPTNVHTAMPGVSISLYPNPAQDRLYLGIEGTSGGVSATVLDASGRVCMQWRIAASVHYREAVDVTRLVPGNYLLQLRNEQGEAVRAFSITQ